VARTILVIDGHPDPEPKRFCHALARVYGDGAREAGAAVRTFRLADTDVPPLRSMAEFNVAPDDPTLLAVRADIEWADHLVFIFPLWLGSAPAKLRGLLEQIARGGFVADIGGKGGPGRLKGKSARLIVTMGMPAAIYRLMFNAHGVLSLKKSILGFAGVAPVGITLLGGIEMGGDRAAHLRLARVKALGRRQA
jgi:putative NADPH-quinone reductase